MRRLTVCILEGKPVLPKRVKVVAGISGNWDEKPESLGANLAMDFNYLKAKLEQQYGCKIPRIVLGCGRSVIITNEDIIRMWKEQHRR